MLKLSLTATPKALSDTTVLLHEAWKSIFADAIWSTINKNAASIPDDIRYYKLNNIPHQRRIWAKIMAAATSNLCPDIVPVRSMYHYMLSSLAIPYFM